MDWPVEELDYMRSGEVAALEKMCFDQPWGEKTYDRFLRTNHWVGFYVQDRGMMLGYIVASWILNRSEIFNLGVHPAYRRRGVASSLLRVFLARIRGLGPGAEVLLEVRASNQAVITLYKRFGFQKIGRRENYYPDNQEAALLLGLCF